MNAELSHAALPVSPMETNRCASAGNPNLVAARELAIAGYKIFPAGPDKKPLVQWSEKATDDLDQIEAWWEKWPHAMPALPTGETNGIAVLDLDRKNGKDGFKELGKIGLDPEELGHVQVQTPSGGQHIYFRFERGIRNSAGKLVRPSGAESGASSGLALLTPAECAGLPPRDYVIKGLIGQSQIGCVFGDPGAGKSLIAPAMGYAVAQGRAAFGMRTSKGEVFYIAAEDAAGMQGRVAALRLENGDADSFKLVPGVSDLFAPNAPDLKALHEIVKERRPKLIFIDTLAMAFPGMDENTSEAMGRVIWVARKLAMYGAAVILIHHGTKAEGNTPRGHSLFNGALDMALHLKPKDQFGVVRGKLTKNRNGSCDLDIAFTIGTRELGIDHDGDTITAAFAHELPGGGSSNVVRLSPSAKAAKDVLTSLMEGKPVVALDDWRRACITDRSVSGAENEESRAKAFKRALEKLCREKIISVEDGCVRWEASIVKEVKDADFGSERDLV